MLRFEMKWALILSVLFSLCWKAHGKTSAETVVLFPEIQQSLDEMEVCTTVRLFDDTKFLTGIEPIGNTKKLHHFSVYACPTIARYYEGDNYTPLKMENRTMVANSYGSCEAHARRNVRHQYCSDGTLQRVMTYDETPQKYFFPKDHGFALGDKLKFVVLSLHYMEKPSKDDKIGMRLHWSDEVKHPVGSLSLVLWNFQLPPRAHTNVQSVVRLNDRIDGTVIAYFGHTHGLGRRVSGFKRKANHQPWDLIASLKTHTHKHPVNMDREVRIKQGDELAIQCSMENDRNHLVRSGRTNEDEMCYVYFWFRYNNKRPEGYALNNPTLKDLRPQRAANRFLKLPTIYL